MNCMVCREKFCAYKVPMFSTFSCEELEEVFKLIKHRDVKKGEVLLQDGEQVKSLIILNEGRLKSYHYTKEGREQILSVMKEGDTLCELQLLKESRFKGYVKAITDCNICTLNKDEFQKILCQNPLMCMKVLEVVGERLEHLERLALVLADKDGEIKLAYVLLDFAMKYGVETENGILISLPITKEEMASYAGVTRETLSRKLKIFCDQGIIRMIGHKQIEIMDQEGLELFL